MKKVSVVCMVLIGALCAMVFSCASSGGGKDTTTKLVSGWDWVVNGDGDNGGTSTIEMTEGTAEGKPAYSFSGSITNDYQYGFVNVKCHPDIETLESLKAATAFSFRILGDGDRYAVKITTSDIEDYAYYEYPFDTIDGSPVTVVVPIGYLVQPAWGTYKKFNQENAMFIEFQTTRNGEPGPYTFKVWDLQLYSGGVPVVKAPKASKTAAAAPAAKTPGGDLGAFNLKLDDNFQYGDNYQGILSDKRLFNGHKIGPGETYTLKITYTASRDLEEILEVALVDTTPAANYWKPLSYLNDDDGMTPLPLSKAGEEVSVTIKLTTVNSSTGVSGSANAMVFGTKGEGVKGRAGSGTQKPVTLSFTEFVFTKE